MAHDLTWSDKNNRRKSLKNHIHRFLLYPDFWSDTLKHIGHNLKWKKIKFAENNFSQIPSKTGIYCFVVIPPTPNLFITRYLFYIGKASSTNLKTRYKQYINEKNGIGIGDQKPRIKIEEMLNEYYGNIYFFYSEIPIATNVLECETKLLNTFFPYVNTLIPEATISEEYRHIY